MEHLNLNRPPDPPKAVAVIRTPVVSGPYPNAAMDRTSGSDSVVMEYLRILKRRRLLVIVLMLVGLTLGIVATTIQTPLYRAATSLEILNLNADFLNLKQSNPVDNTENSYDTSEVLTQVKILQNEELLDRVVAKLSSSDAAEEPKPQGATPLARVFTRLAKMPIAGGQPSHRELLNKAIKSLQVRTAPRTRIVEVTVDSTDPHLAADVANTLDNQFIEQNLEARWKTTQGMGEWLGRELEEARDKLAHAEGALQTYARNSGLIFTRNDSSVATEKLQQIQQQLTAASADRIAKQSQYELAQNGRPEALPGVLGDQGYRDALAKLNDLHGQIAELSAIYNPDYGKLKQAQAQAASLQAAAERSRSDLVARIKNEYTDAARREKLLAAAYNAQTYEVTGQGDKAIQYNILKSEVDSSRQLYDVMLQQLKQSSIATAINASNIRIVNPAKTPSIPVSPSLPRDSGLGILLGMFAGITVAVIRERTDRTLRQPGHAPFWTDLPELGVIPSASFVNDKTLKGVYSRIRGIEESANRKGRRAERLKEALDLTFSDRERGYMAEAFRTVRTSILFVGERSKSPRTLVFTSAAPGDGKTTVVSNLGISLAEIGRKVLIIDADLNRPRQADIFGVPNDQGLSTLLKSPQLKPDSLAGLVQETKVPGLWILPSGPAAEATVSLLHSPRLAELLIWVKREFDMVLIDTPPMLQLTDARVLGRRIDAVVLVARAEQTTRDALSAASKQLAEDGIRVLGTILNDWNPKRSPSYAYYRR
jgi:succinoglycan biosynthesis transport protein ExoP